MTTYVKIISPSSAYRTGGARRFRSVYAIYGPVHLLKKIQGKMQAERTPGVSCKYKGLASTARDLEALKKRLYAEILKKEGVPSILQFEQMVRELKG